MPESQLQMLTCNTRVRVKEKGTYCMERCQLIKQ